MKLRNLLATVVLVVACTSVGYEFGRKRLELDWRNWKAPLVVNKAPVGVGRAADMAQFWDAWERVTKEYVDKTTVDPQRLVQGATAGMVAALGDPYTVYLTPEQNREIKADLGGTFEGVGIQLGFVEKRLAVVAPLEGTPAKRAGVKPGDLIVRIKDDQKQVDRDAAGLTLPQAVELIRGKRGTMVQLTLARAGVEELIKVDLVRETIVVHSVDLEMVGQVAWLKLNRFGDKTQTEWDDAIEKIKIQNAKSVVLDVRNNPGGYLDGAIYTASEFLARGRLVVVQQRGDGSREEGRVTREGKLVRIPLVVLVNEGSASASEILAGALQDNKRAKIVGAKTFGKGSVQQPEDFGDGAGIHITIAKWLTPKGVWIDKNGIVPDVEVKIDSKKEIKSRDDDEQLQKALELLR